MSFRKNDARQGSVWAGISRKNDTTGVITNDVRIGDYTSGTAVVAVDVPAGAVVVGGMLVVDTAWDTGTSAAVVVGDSGTANRYLTSTSIKSTGRTALTPTGYRYPTADTIRFTITDTGTAPTVGTARLYVEYIVDGRAQFTQG